MILDFLIHKLTEFNPPEFNEDKCINSFDKINGCSKCMESCSENAISIKENKVLFDEKNCNLCGTCSVICPTQAIKMKGIGIDEIIADADEKKNLVFACSSENGTGNLNTSCLNALHPELIAYLFIMHREKEIYFNLSKCTDCKLGYDNTMFKDSLNKAEMFANTIGINPMYKIYTEEDELSNLVVEEISRRNLFKLIKKESGNMVVKTMNSIIDSEDNSFSIRNILLNSIKSIKFKDENKSNIFWEYWDVNIDCDGCGKCISVCPGKAWKLEKDEDEIKLHHKFVSCYKCGLCEKICPKKAIAKGKTEEHKLDYTLKRKIKLSTCKLCNKQFIPVGDEDECDVCKKKELLRKKISLSN